MIYVGLLRYTGGGSMDCSEIAALTRGSEVVGSALHKSVQEVETYFIARLSDFQTLN
jgi:hypothetical protein